MANIIGTVYDVNEIPIPNVTIVLIGSGEVPKVSITSTDGTYYFSGLSAGHYKLFAIANRSVSEYFADIVNGQASNTVVNFKLTFFSSKLNLVDFLIKNRFVLLKYLQYGFLGYIGYFFFVKLIGYGMPSLGLSELDDIEKARGAITYLVAVTTISMAAILMLASIMTGGKDLAQRFALGKEILTLLIGILGTIIGFYYGSSIKTSEPINNPHIEILELSQDPKDLKVVYLNGEIHGGYSPYSYSITVDQPTIFQKIIPKNTLNGLLIDTLHLINMPKSKFTVKLSISGNDKYNKKFEKVQNFYLRDK